MCLGGGGVVFCCCCLFVLGGRGLCLFFLPCATPNRDLIFSLMKEVILQKKKVDHTQECMQGGKKLDDFCSCTHGNMCCFRYHYPLRRQHRLCLKTMFSLSTHQRDHSASRCLTSKKLCVCVCVCVCACVFVHVHAFVYNVCVVIVAKQRQNGPKASWANSGKQCLYVMESILTVAVCLSAPSSYASSSSVF